MSELVKDLEHIIWSYLAIPILLFVSLVFTFYFQGVQFRFKKMIQCLTKKSSNSSVSSFQSFTMALAARVGVGSLAGVALGIYIGGPGSVFWMWISALITAAASFVESTLAQLYKKRDGDIYIGGPAYYIEYWNASKRICSYLCFYYRLNLYIWLQCNSSQYYCNVI